MRSKITIPVIILIVIACMAYLTIKYNKAVERFEKRSAKTDSLKAAYDRYMEKMLSNGQDGTVEDSLFLKYTYHNAHTLDEEGRCMVVELTDKHKDDEGKILPILKFYDMATQQFLGLEPLRIIREVKEIRPGYYALYDDSGLQVYSIVMPYVNGDSYYKNNDEIQIIDCDPEYWHKQDQDSDAFRLSRNVREAEAQLVKLYEESGGCGYELIDYVANNPSTLHYPFDKINKDTDVSIRTSADGAVRFYTWDTHTGGTSPNFASYVQYDDGKSIKVRCFAPFTSSKYVCERDVMEDGYEPHDEALMDILYQIDGPDGRPVYITSAYFKASSTEGSKDIFALQIIDGKLQKAPFIDKEGQEDLTVGCRYCIPDWYFTTDGLGWDWVPSFDSETKTLYVPERGDMELSDRYDKYRLVDGKMRYVGNGAGYWLHPSLHDFKRLAGIYRTKTKLIRVDILANGDYRYASWSKHNAMSGPPELILTGGKTDVIENAIVFENGSYRYIVPAYRHGSGDDFDKLIIKKNGKVIQQEKV